MSTVTVTFDSSGAPTPANITVQQGDTVSWVADGADIVLCVDPAAYFGAERFEIPDGQTLDLTVQSPPLGGFDFVGIAGDLSASCDDGGGRGTGDGRGEP